MVRRQTPLGLEGLIGASGTHLALAAIFFASGFAALVYQVAWQRVLTQMVGIDAYSVTMIVAIFMLALGLGSLVGGAFAGSRLDLLGVFVAAEMGIGVFGFFSADLIRALGRTALAARSDLPVEFLLNFMLLLAPTLLMGMSLPLVIQLFRVRYGTGPALGVLYTANILGAAAGALVAGFLAVGLLGVDTTCRMTAALNLLIAGSAAALSRRRGDLPSAQADAEIDRRTDAGAGPPVPVAVVAVLSGVSGFVALSYEILYFRIFSTYFGLTSYVFPILLAAYLVCLAIGNRYFGFRAERDDAVKLLAIGSAGAVITTLPVLFLQTSLDLLGIDPARYFVLLQTLRAQLFLQLVGITGLSILLLAPVAFLSVYFPVLARAGTRSRDRTGASVGWVYFTQTMGNFLGVVVTGLLLLPAIGTVWSLRILAFVLAVLPIAYAWSSRPDGRPWRARSVVWGAAICVVVSLAYPLGYYGTIRVARVAPERVMESAMGVSLIYRERDLLRVTVGREGTAAFFTEQSTVDCSPHEFTALLNGQVRRALIIGIGGGSLPICLQSLYPGVTVDIIELNPSLIELMREQGDRKLRRSLELSNVYVTDGRRFVNKHPDERYDFIQVGVYHVTASGSGSLFTREFQAQLRDLLTPNGVLTFNAYPPAIKASLALFSEVVVVSHESMVGTMFASNVSLPALTAAWVSRLPPSIFADGVATSERAYWPNACVYSRVQVADLVSDVREQTDALPVTEYFITQRQNIVGARNEDDLRRWGCRSQAARP